MNLAKAEALDIIQTGKISNSCRIIWYTSEDCIMDQGLGKAI
jgi:hypothetical protein